MKKCPYCAEEIQDEAIVCRYCGRDLTKPTVLPQPAPSKPAAPAALPQPKPISKVNTLFMAIGVAIGAICLCIVVGMAMNRNSVGQKPPLTATSQPAQPIIGATVEYSTPSKVPATSTPSTDPTLGKTRENPYPVGAKVDLGGGVQMSILYVSRPADDLVLAGNMFNRTPEPDKEYMVVALQVDCTKATNETCHFSTYQIKVVGANGQVQDRAPVAGIPQSMESSNELFGGGYVEGVIPFLATAGDESIVLFYEPLIFGDPIYISLK